MARKAIPSHRKHQILYASAYVCAICQGKGCQLHHIDGDHSNDAEENLICICTTHHDEAHTKRQLSQNLSPEALRHAKNSWNSELRSRREAAASVSGQIALSGDPSFASLGVTWGYINHSRVIQMASLESLSAQDKGLLAWCVDRGIVDQYGIPVKPTKTPKAHNYLENTIYDLYPFGDNQRLHKLYVALVDQLSRIHSPIHLEREWWTKARIRELLTPGALVFAQSEFYVNPVSETTENEHRRVTATRKKVSIEFFVDTRDMFGTTSMTISFRGHQACGAFLQLKSMGETNTGQLVLNCTPIGLGVAFNKSWT